MSPDEVVHYGGVDARPTSLHGNGAASFRFVTTDRHQVTCQLCLSLLMRPEVNS
jgi:hypothetical protein